MHYVSAGSPSVPGLYAIIRVGPGVNTVECDGFEHKRRADQVAHALTEAYNQREAASLARAMLPPAERRLVQGFYTDEDAK